MLTPSLAARRARALCRLGVVRTTKRPEQLRSRARGDGMGSPWSSADSIHAVIDSVTMPPYSPHVSAAVTQPGSSTIVAT
ncbi:MAG: hypothetical protein ACRD0K_20315 [Egibacteraceae bacterium]